MGGDTILDITGLNGPTIRHDLEHRDVTINAMAFELSSGTLLDWVGGRRDLAGKKIRMVSERGFSDDPIRLLRVFRLAASLGFSIEERTISTIARDAALIRFSAGERIRSELCLLFSCRDSASHVGMMATTGLLRAVFSELPPQPAIGDIVVSNTALRTPFMPAYHHLEALLNHPPPGYPPPDTGIDPAIPEDYAAWLKLAMILTRQTRRPDNLAAGGRRNGGPFSGKHENMGGNVTEAACRRLRLSTKEKIFVTGLVSNHARPFQLRNAFADGRLTPQAATRFFMTVGALTPYLLLCALAEVRSSPADRKSFSDFTAHLLRAYYDIYLPGKARPAFVSGHDLIHIFSLRPSPLFKRILIRLEEGQLSGEFTDRASALQMAEKMILGFKP